MATRRDQATKDAITKYQKEKCKQLAVRFTPVDMELLEYVKSQDEGIAPYIKRLIREDMARNATNK